MMLGVIVECVGELRMIRRRTVTVARIKRGSTMLAACVPETTTVCSESACRISVAQVLPIRGASLTSRLANCFLLPEASGEALDGSVSAGRGCGC